MHSANLEEWGPNLEVRQPFSEMKAVVSTSCRKGNVLKRLGPFSEPMGSENCNLLSLGPLLKHTFVAKTLHAFFIF